MTREQEPRDPEHVIDEPVLDGATETFKGTEDPRKGDEDPALIRDLETHEPTTNPYG